MIPKATFRSGFSAAQLPPMGIGYVTIPSDITPEEHIADAIRRERITIATAAGQALIHECIVAKHVFNDIVFPSEPGGIGSPIVYICDKFQSVPFIIAVTKFADDTGMVKKNTFRLAREIADKDVAFIGDAEEGNIVLTALTPNSKAGLSINIIGDETSEILLNTSGSLNAFTNKDINLNSANNIKAVSESEIKLEIGRELTSSFYLSSESVKLEIIEGSQINLTKEDINLIPVEKFNVGSGSQPIALGNTTKEVVGALRDISENIVNILTEFSSTQSAASSGMLAPLAPGFTKLNADLTGVVIELNEVVTNIDIMLSDISFTD